MPLLFLSIFFVFQSLFSRKRLQASGRAEAPVIALKARPAFAFPVETLKVRPAFAFAFELYYLTQRQATQACWTVASKLTAFAIRFCFFLKVQASTGFRVMFRRLRHHS